MTSQLASVKPPRERVSETLQDGYCSLMLLNHVHSVSCAMFYWLEVNLVRRMSCPHSREGDYTKV